MVFGRPFVKRFPLCYRSVVCVCPVCLSVTFVHYGQTVGRIKAKLGTQVGLGPGHTVLDGDPAPAPTKGHSPQFLAHICCGQMAAWTKMSLGMELGLGQSDFVLDGTMLPLTKRGRSPTHKFSAHVYCGQTAGWMKLVLGKEVGRSPGDFVLDGNPAPPSPKVAVAPRNFRPMFIAAKRLDE